VGGSGLTGVAPFGETAQKEHQSGPGQKAAGTLDELLCDPMTVLLLGWVAHDRSPLPDKRVWMP